MSCLSEENDNQNVTGHQKESCAQFSCRDLPKTIAEHHWIAAPVKCFDISGA